MKRKLFKFKAYLDNGETADVIYISEYWSDKCILNNITSCIYKEVEIYPLIKTFFGTDIPAGIFQSVENNAENMWSDIINLQTQS